MNIKKRLLEPVLEEGVRSPNFFNGRFLTAEDLKAEQTSNRAQRRQLGIAIGEGVVRGLEVERLSDTKVTVYQGLAIGPSGQVSELHVDVDLEIVPEAQASSAQAGLFADCLAADTAVLGKGEGVYLLVMGPASGYDGRAAMSGPDGDGKVTGCGSDAAVAGVTFRLLTISADNELKDPDHLRNRLAYRFFGAGVQLAAYGQPFAKPTAAAGLMTELRAQMTACEVPLAVLHWAGGKIKYVDMWSVRRRTAEPSASLPWAFHVGPQRLVDGEAMFLQFQEEIDWLQQNLTAAQRQTLYAGYRFRYLPPAGYLPSTFNWRAFFGNAQTEVKELDTAFLRELIHQSYFVEPMDVQNLPPIWIYQPAQENYVIFLRRPQAQSETPYDWDQWGALTVKLAASDTAAATASKPTATVVAVDAAGQQYPAKLVSTAAAEEVSVPGKTGKRKVLATYQAEKLPPGEYTVKATVQGFRPANKQKDVVAGATGTVIFDLQAQSTGGTTRPGASGPGQWISPGWYGKISVLDKYRGAHTPPEVIKEWEQYTDPPPDEEDWLQNWAVELGGDPGDIRIYIDPAHTPDVVATDPYAYAVFGENGAYAPLVLTPGDMTLGRSVSVTKGVTKGLDQYAYESQLKPAGLGEADVLAAAWTGLVADVLGVSAGAAGKVVEAARSGVDKLLGDNALQVFTGVDSTLEGVLKEAGISSAVDLANKTVAELEALVGDRTHAELLLDQARSAVPAGSWSLAAGDLGLKSGEVAKLAELGVATQGDLKAMAATEAGKTQIAQTLGIAGTVVDTLAAKVTATAETTLLARDAAAPVTTMFGVDASGAKSLATAGIGTVEALAVASVETVSQVMGVDAAKATSMVNAAKTRLKMGGF